MRRIPSELIQRIKDSVDIVDLIGSYTPLTKKGNRYWACCPFHHEKTPSFAVSRDKGFYYCFGCHASGNVFTFLEKMENLSFVEAVERLAELTHIELPQEEMTPEERQREADRALMYQTVEMASRYFHNCLTKTRMGEAGLAYFTKRHLSPETIEAFQLGFAPPQWDKLFRDFTEKKHTAPRILQETGLVGYSNGRYFDMFRNRCMFPILDLKGKPVAFGGRVMDDSKPKYLNSPETPIFNKRRLLFALYQALPEIRKKRQVIMVEGYMDAISLHAHGVTNVVASLGTAFTVEQARLLKRYADEIVFSYDMDAAGQNATRRALEIAGPVGLKIRVAQVGEGKDPDEFVNLHGGEAYLEAVKEAKPAYDYLLSSLLRQYDPASLEGQQKILEAMFSVLAAKNDSFLLNSFITKMARVMRADEGLIRSEASRYIRKHGSSLYVSPKENKEETASKESQKQQRLEEEFLKFCILHHTYPDQWEEMKDFPYEGSFAARAAEAMKAMEEEGLPLAQDSLESRLSGEDISHLAALLMKNDDTLAVPWEEYIRPLTLGRLQKEYKLHSEKADSLSQSDPEGSRREMLACLRLSREIRALQEKVSRS